jgi:hypothetical protein
MVVLIPSGWEDSRRIPFMGMAHQCHQTTAGVERRKALNYLLDFQI